MNREQAKEEIKRSIKCTEYLTKSKSGLYECPYCGSGTGPNGSGAVKYYEDTNTCYCHACQKAFDVFDLYMNAAGVDFNEALSDLANVLNIAIDPYRPAATPAEDFSDPIPEADTAPGDPSFTGKTTPQASVKAEKKPVDDRDFSKYYQECRQRLTAPAAVNYLAGRGISTATAEAYWVGYDPAADPANAPGAGADARKPHPCPRIIVPCSRGHYIARSIDPNTPAAFKKMNPKDATPAIFNLRALYAEGVQHVFVAEGAFDALSILEAGQPAISLNSAGNTDKLIEQLKKQPTKATLILCLDNDERGKAAMDKLRAGLTHLGISYIRADITGTHKDPNEALCADRAAFEQAIAKAVAGTAARPDNTATYLDNEMPDEIKKFKDAQNRRTGFSNIDEKAGGLYPGLYVLAAISSLGKTTLALQMADQIAEAGQDVLFFSMEQSRLELVSKSLARITAQNDITNAVTSLSIRRGYLPLAVQNAAEQYKAQTGGRVSIIEGNFNCDIGYITDYIHLYQQRTGTAPVVFIDYLQILQPTDEGKSKLSKREEIGKAVTELKRLSREGLTIIVISSLNRANYLTPIAFESLKESGDIEYTADVVWGLQLACLDEDEVFEAEGKIKKKRKAVEKAKAENPRKITFTCLKNRYGISSYDCRFYYYPQYDLFVPTMDTGSAPSQARRNTAKDVTGGVRRT